MMVDVKVKKSKIGKTGRTRVCQNALESLELEDGTDIVITSDEKSITLKAFTDDLVEEGVIYLREKDMNSLKVNEDDIVSISPHETLTKKAKEKVPWPKKDKDEEE